MKMIKLITIFLFIKVDFDATALTSTNVNEYDYLKKQVVNFCKDFLERSFCVWSPKDYNNYKRLYSDLKTFVLKECSTFIPVLQYSSVEYVISECEKVVLVEPSQFDICEFILLNSPIRTVTIAVLTHKTISTFINDSEECRTLFDSMNILVISVPNGEKKLLSSTVSEMDYVVENGEIKRNPKIIIPNFQGKLVKVATFSFPPFVLLRNITGSVEYIGIEMSLFLKMAAYLNFTWEVVPLKSPGRYGRFENGTVVGGMVQALREGAADIGFCNMWQRFISLSSMEFGPPLNLIYVTFIVRRPYQLLDQWQSLFMIFTITVWLTIGVTFLILTFVYWLACHAAPVVTRKPSMTESLMFLLGILTISSSYSIPASLISRLVILWSFFFALLMMTAVTSCIVTRLTLPLYSPRVDTVAQLVEGGYYWTDPSYLISNEVNKEFFFDMNDDWHRLFENRYEYIPPNQIVPLILSDPKVVLPVQRWGIEHVLVNIDGVRIRTDLSMFRVMRGYTRLAFTSFVYRRYSGYNELFNRVFQLFVEFGMWQKQKRLMTFMRLNRKYLLEEEYEHDFSHLQPLTLVNLYPAFVILVIGHCVAVFILLIELICNKMCEYCRKTHI